MDARALVLRLSAKSMREKPKTTANTAYARQLTALTVPQVWTRPGLRLAGRAARRRAGMVPGTVTARATLLTVRAIHAVRRACAHRA